ncbi:hypothetical protein [Streptomyces sp. NRRL B-24484]|uniref:hypothetical protein n=1 Tax=Streptomyces sp. NRRL B-24484 TaxID=1463833 RepID=UPI000693F763|nr:hypothetical protein [Streptomyces sp. NRRL B-24484]
METTEPDIRPHRVLTGFALLLVLVFAGAFALGRAVGPVAPGLRPATGGTPVPGHPGDGMPGHGQGAAR